MCKNNIFTIKYLKKNEEATKIRIIREETFIVNINNLSKPTTTIQDDYVKKMKKLISYLFK